MEKTIEINIKDIFRAALRKIWMIIFCIAVGAVVLYVYSSNFVTPKYKATVSIYVNNNANTSTVSGITSSDLSTSQKLVKTYVNMIKSYTVLEKVAETTGLEITPLEIRDMLSAESVDNTEMFNVEITNTDPMKAMIIANAVAQVAPAEIANFVEGSSTKIIDYARLPENPVSIGTVKTAVLGAGAGLMVAIAIVVAQVMLDIRIKGEEDLKRISPAPVLGAIPDFAESDHGGYSKYGYGYGYAAKKQKDGKEGK